ncbi:hypothetical protein KCU59_g72, partial [Aureobasidium melanogenum]
MNRITRSVPSKSSSAATLPTTSHLSAMEMSSWVVLTGLARRPASEPMTENGIREAEQIFARFDGKPQGPKVTHPRCIAWQQEQGEHRNCQKVGQESSSGHLPGYRIQLVHKCSGSLSIGVVVVFVLVDFKCYFSVWKEQNAYYMIRAGRSRDGTIVTDVTCFLARIDLDVYRLDFNLIVINVVSSSAYFYIHLLETFGMTAHTLASCQQLDLMFRSRHCTWRDSCSWKCQFGVQSQNGHMREASKPLSQLNSRARLQMAKTMSKRQKTIEA